MAEVFRGKYLAGLRRAFDRGALPFAGSVAPCADRTAFEAFLATRRAEDWVAYVVRRSSRQGQPPSGGPEQVLEYLGRYPHQVAFSNDRLVRVADGVGRFRWRDCAHGTPLKTMALSGGPVPGPVALHVLPDGFVRICHFGLLAHRGRRAPLARCPDLLAAAPPAPPPAPQPGAALLLPLTGLDITRCPICRVGRLHVVGRRVPGALPGPGGDTS